MTPPKADPLAERLRVVPMCCPRGEGHNGDHAPDNCAEMVPDGHALAAEARAYVRERLSRAWPCTCDVCAAQLARALRALEP